MTWWAEHPLWAACLRPLSWGYALGWGLMKALRGGRAWKAPVPVISVGNLSVGGTGKSPLVHLIAARLPRPAILLRGYGAQGGPRPLAVKPATPAEASGDEAREHAQAVRAAVWVDADRKRSAQAAIAAGARSLVLDDGFQRRWQVQRDLDLLLADWEQIQAGERLLPAGPWREPWSQAQQAGAVLISGAPKGADLTALPKPWSQRPLFRLDLQPRGLLAWPKTAKAPLSRLKGRRVAALSGLGNPARFEASLKALGAKVLPWRFADHHPFSAAELAVPPAGAELIVCTRKDAQRLPKAWKPALPVWVLLAQAQVTPAAPFQTLLKKALRGRHA